ncbi:hypothetical protein DBR43_17795 [Pedobacter sp. KBW06]|nr:hypothetical protein DBR43_17795 [Pedobacter sp. KBW06]
MFFALLSNIATLFYINNTRSNYFITNLLCYLKRTAEKTQATSTLPKAQHYKAKTTAGIKKRE